MDQEHAEPIVEETKPKNKPEEQDFWRFAAELVRTALIVSILAYVLRLFVIEPFVVEGSSMTPNFHNNDFLLVDKVNYVLHTPERGDVVVFKYPLDTSVNYIKRIIGLPGETVKIADNKVTIITKDNPNGTTLSEPYLSSDAYTGLPEDQKDNEYTVPADEYFVLGDNRAGSSDSRAWGFLPKEDIIGRVDLRMYPFSDTGIVHQARY